MIYYTKSFSNLQVANQKNTKKILASSYELLYTGDKYKHVTNPITLVSHLYRTN
jgi:hypothetical protein